MPGQLNGVRLTSLCATVRKFTWQEEHLIIYKQTVNSTGNSGPDPQLVEIVVAPETSMELGQFTSTEDLALYLFDRGAFDPHAGAQNSATAQKC